MFLQPPIKIESAAPETDSFTRNHRNLKEKPLKIVPNQVYQSSHGQKIALWKDSSKVKEAHWLCQLASMVRNHQINVN